MATNVSSAKDKIAIIAQSATPLKEQGEEYRMLLDLVSNAEIVLLGESTHGTHEFYRERAHITKLLIRECGFSAIAIESDWPDAFKVNTFINDIMGSDEGVDALANFTRFPRWMWKNADVLDFIGWLRNYNEQAGTKNTAVSFYGLDLYSLYNSARVVIRYLEKVDPDAAERARSRYGCLSRFGEDGQQYALATRLGLSRVCADGLVRQLVDLLEEGEKYRVRSDGMSAEEKFFDAEQNSRLVIAAERYYRSMVEDDTSSWNLRDQHMADTLAKIREHLLRMNRSPKVIIWAHNSHIGDARATEMGWRQRELSIGQLVREAYAGRTVSVGFTTYSGTVTAASKWDGDPQRKRVRDALPGSYEDLFHGVGIPRFFLDFKNNKQLSEVLLGPLLERAIGVLYLPETERLSHYFMASMPEQFDAAIHFDRTRAVEPLEHEGAWGYETQTPETYPSGV